MTLKKIDYAELNARQREAFNFQKVAGLLADYGFNCIKLADDWRGADFLAYHKDGTHTLKVQLKSRLCIARMYQAQSIFMAFPIGSAWYLVKHDHLAALIGKHSTWLSSESWKARGHYSSTNANPKLTSALTKFKL